MPNHFRHCLTNKKLFLLHGEHPWAEPKISWVYSVAQKKRLKEMFLLIINIPKSYHLAPKEEHASSPAPQ